MSSVFKGSAKVFFLGFSIFLLAHFSIRAQTIISGQINSFDSLVSFNTNPCGDELVTAGLSSYTVGDLILIYSKSNATCSLNNSSSFGTLQNLNETGLYQLLRVKQVNGNTIHLTNSLNHSYPTGSQIVKVPEYQSARINTSLITSPYNNGLGGILCLKAERLIQDGQIVANGSGFKGGFSNRNMGYSCGESDYYYPLNNNGGAPKGRGIVSLGNAYDSGRGRAINGGGGGNNHNAGGGGGSNGGSGGSGGNEWGSCNPVATVGGIGGMTLVSDSSRFYLGGGGGSGHNNLSNTSSEGGDGGGLILIIADTLEVISGSISANGLNGKSMSNGAEGSGGGGSGGSIVLQLTHILGSLNINDKGGDGGSSTGGLAGPGGGGGGGMIFLPPVNALNMSAGSFSFLVSGGAAGHLSNSSNNYGSGPGQSGALNRSLSLVLPDNHNFLAMLGPDTSVCGLDSVLLSANVSGTKVWSTGLIDDSIYVFSSGLYWIELNQNGCLFRDSIRVEFNNPSPFSLGEDTSICANDCSLSAPRSGDWLWNTNSTDSIITVNQSAWYWLEIEEGACTFRDSIYIEFFDLPDLNLPEEIVLCLGDSINLSAPSGFSFLWNDGFAGSTRWISNAGLYWLEISNSDACTMRDSTLIILSSDRDTLDLFSSKDTLFCIEEGLRFDFNDLGLDLVWQDGINADIRNFRETKLIWAEYESQCAKLRDSIYIEAVPCDTCLLIIPNAFSPNDDGLNDEFSLKNACEFEQYHLSIYSRWGEKMFESRLKENSWDGNYYGRKAMEGSYIYELTYKLPYREIRKKYGVLTLIR